MKIKTVAATLLLTLCAVLFSSEARADETPTTCDNLPTVDLYDPWSWGDFADGDEAQACDPWGDCAVYRYDDPYGFGGFWGFPVGECIELPTFDEICEVAESYPDHHTNYGPETCDDMRSPDIAKACEAKRVTIDSLLQSYADCIDQIQDDPGPAGDDEFKQNEAHDVCGRILITRAALRWIYSLTCGGPH